MQLSPFRPDEVTQVQAKHVMQYNGVSIREIGVDQRPVGEHAAELPHGAGRPPIRIPPPLGQHRQRDGGCCREYRQRKVTIPQVFGAGDLDVFFQALETGRDRVAYGVPSLV